MADLSSDEPAPARLSPMSSLVTAQLFHGHYERLASMYGYKTREESAVPWSEVPQANRMLMIATARAVLTDLGFEVAE